MADAEKSEEKPRPTPHMLRRLFGEYRWESKLTVLAGAIALVTAFGELVPAWFVRQAVNYFGDWVRAGQPGRLVVWAFAVPIVIVVVIQNLLRYSQTMARADLGVRLTNRLRERMYEAVQRHSLTYHKKQTTGDLIARSTRDINSMGHFLNFAVFNILDLVVFLGGAIAVLVWVNPMFALIALSPLPLAVYLTIRFGRRVRGKWRDANDAYGEVTTVLQENIAGARVVRAFAQEVAEERKFGGRIDSYVGKIIAALDFWITRTLFSSFVFGLVMPVALAYGAYAVIKGWMREGDMTLCFFYMAPVEQRLHHLIHTVEVYQNAAAGAERVFEILDEEPTVRTSPGARPIPALRERGGAEVEFRNVSFGYDPEKRVLCDVSLVAPGGETIALVGRTGSGKSTLISLIPRFHDVTAGAVLVNGTDVRDIKLEALRRSIGIIFQETFLFSATVRDNIAYGHPGASTETVEAAAKAAQAHEFITQLEKGYDTVIGERGVTLSGGQAQRIAIARAILLDPKVLIMDDATASVDSETERHIRETMRAVSAGRTNFVIAHRISSVAHADRIYVLDGGRVVEQGTHAELVALGGMYGDMCAQQLAGKLNGV